MTPFRQTILPGDSGSDITAVKRAFRKMGVKGAGGLAYTNKAGPSFVNVTGTVQRQHHLQVDGVYGPATHKIVAPFFDLYGVALYKAAKIRRRPEPSLPAGDAQTLAARLLHHQADGSYHADNPGDLRDLQATAAGKAVWSQGGYWVHIDPRPLRLLCWLIENHDYKLGTYAICSDHHNDGPHGHSGGFAVDISSINGVPVAAATAKADTLAVAVLLSTKAPPEIRPRQLICGGYGNHRDPDISACSLPAADSFYGSTVMSQHTDHVHAGF